MGHDSSASFDYDAGKVTQITDPNSVITTASYSGDALDRLLEVVRGPGLGGSLQRRTVYSYGDTVGSLNLRTQADQISNDQLLDGYVYYDGLGRRTRVSQVEASRTVYTDTQYDGLGRVWKVSNPYPSTGSAVWTTTTHDALGRVTSVQTPDGATTTIAYSGYFATVTDPAGASRRSQTDALGRLVGVVEDSSGLNYTTSYAYDLMDNLTGVAQDGQPRTFTYDSAKRLLSAANPESGTTSYTYDANGNLVTSTDARNQTTTRQYDDLDRVYSTSYPDGNGGSVQATTCYDGQTASGSSCTGGTSVKGILSDAVSPASRTAYTADVLGRVTASTQTVDSVNYGFAYTYNADGSLKTEQYPSGRVVAYSYDRAARPATVGLTTVGATTYASVGYKPHGAIETLTFGSGLIESWDYDQYRLQPVSMSAGSLLTLGFSYGTATTNNGNLMQQTITVPGLSSTLTQAYRYDKANRLTFAGEYTSTPPATPSCPDGGSVWCHAYGYGARGNRTVTGRTGIGVSALEAASFGTDNRVADTGWTYDSAGNLVKVPSNETMGYDGQNHQVAYCMLDSTPSNCVPVAASGRTLYAYDVEGRRVKKVLGSSTTTYIYDAFGKLAAEYGGTPPAAGGRMYLTADHLGSTRLVTNASGGPVERSDFLPFGEELLVSSGSPRFNATGYTADSGIPLKFTAKPHDGETSLDYFGARYFSAAQGRFTTPDWSARPQPVPYADLSNPQSLNLYAYVRNNPLTNRDPDGHWCVLGVGTTCDKNIPPPPKLPPPPKVDQNVFRAGFDNLRVNQLTVRQVADVVANESRDVRVGTSSTAALQEAKTAQANAVMNADQMFGSLRMQRVHTAPATVTPQLTNDPQYQEALNAARLAYEQQMTGQDPTGGRMFFNNRYNDYLGPRNLGGQQLNVFSHYGPFVWGSQNVYILIYDNPNWR